MPTPSDRPLPPQDATVHSGAAGARPAQGGHVGGHVGGGDGGGDGSGWLLGSTVDDRYRIEAELGRGAMGVVYRAREVWLDRTVALKVIAPALLGDSTAPLGLHREAKALAAIRNEHVVRVHAFGVHEGSYYFVMEYVRGRSLKDLLAEHQAHRSPIPVHRTLTVLAQIAEGVAAVQAAGLVHRDIKPSNIIIEEDTGRPVLVDFGLVTADRVTAGSLVVGSPLYMAPEQTGMAALQGGLPAAISARTDVYALACTAFEMLAGRPPFLGDGPAELRRQHALAPAPAISSIRPDLAAYDAAFGRALAKDPGERHPSCVELSEELALAATRGRTSRLLSSRPPPPVPAPAESNALLRVLVIDLDHDFSRFAAQAVHAAFFRHRKDLRVQIAIAAGGDDAVERAMVEPPDLVLLDYDSPGIDGGEMLSRLRAVGGGERARVVVTSRRIPADERWRFSVLGVRDFVTKPTSFLVLVEALQKVAERMGPADPPDPAPRSRRTLPSAPDLAPSSRRSPLSEREGPPGSRRF